MFETNQFLIRVLKLTFNSLYKFLIVYCIKLITLHKEFTDWVRLLSVK